ncbi:kinesin-like protein KIN-12D [Salvia miltiorrhiza]|uniref:kinesin-like protein KIN-12D n=1 Tax=Salvia miltiorrhiza TaxID=226208 RepID=UPI0025AD7525|nr:kinesin-like protein KIN-12D [Salvia miltiorrhiza]XP_057787422.1 kinesin-like protein KIN-12D [Salvia miltiorrhiza]
MLRDFKFLRRNPAKNANAEEVENVPPNSRDSLNPQIRTEPSRPPFNAITELPPSRIPKSIPDQEANRPNRVDRTPTKPKPRYSDASLPLRTPEKQGAMSRNRFNWAQKSENPSNNGVVELKEEGRIASNVNTPSSTRAGGRATLSYSECNSLQSTPTKSVSKPPNPGFSMPTGSRTVCNMGARMANYAALSKGIPSSCNTSTVVNTVEVPYFELREDPSFWMEHNVQVLIRIRPLNNMEKSSFGFSRCLKQETAQSITWIGQPETRFMFDHVACEGIDQETLFRMVGLPMVENCLSGYNSCMFAYGQTGSGKTYTMLGEIDDLEVKPSTNRGMTPRIFEFLFARIRAEEESRRDEQLKYNCKCSFLEIYNEQITDLLDPSSSNLMLREDMKKGVYVENLSEFEVHTVGDILQLLTQGASNRRVAATNMNRESSRSHSVFTCVIESKWEKDSATNFRFARLNLVDLAGSERQKSSGAEGERLKEAANINKSLSTLGHVIMVLVDVAHGRPRHVPYRDSRLTFLLQDSLGGNSKTMIIANVSPSICSAAETLNTLKFAQRAKLIQNNAIINEDLSGDVVALKHQIQLLKEELAALKRERVNRSLLLSPANDLDSTNNYEDDSDGGDIAQTYMGNLLGNESEGVLRLSCKQLKSLETTVAGSLRREKMAETSVTQFKAEIEQLNRLVSQREEDTRCTKMMLKFREDKIQRMESLLGGLMSADDYLREENNALSEEIQLLRSRLQINPEVTRFAAENIRLLDEVRQFQDFYGEGEREMLMKEVSELRNQLMCFLDGNLKHSKHFDVKDSDHNNEKGLLEEELQKTLSELEESKIKLSRILEENTKLHREIEELRASSNAEITYSQEHDCSAEVIKESIVEVPLSSDKGTTNTRRENDGTHPSLPMSAEDIMDLQLELDILKIILQEERSYHSEQEEIAKSLNQELQFSKEMATSVTKEYEKVKEELKTVKLVVEALESEQIQSINEIEDLRSTNVRFEEMLKEKELQISYLKNQASCQKFKDLSLYKSSEKEVSPLEVRLKKMHESLEMAKRLNALYQNDLAFQASDQDEMEEVRRQVEGETAEVIVCLQEELSGLQQEVHESKVKEMETSDRFAQLETEMKIMEENLRLTSEENAKFSELLEDKENQLKTLTEEWNLIAGEIEGILFDGNTALKDASDQTDVISRSFRHNGSWISEQFGRMKQYIFEKEFLIDELNQYLKDAIDRKDDMERMLRSLRGAALVMTETHQQECSEKDEEILFLTSDLNNKTSTVAELWSLIKHGEDQLRTASSCATAALVIVNRLWELNSNYHNSLQDKELQIREFKEIITKKDSTLQNQALVIDEADGMTRSLQKKLEASEEYCAKLSLELSEEQRSRENLEVNLEKKEENKISEAREQLQELNSGVSSLKLWMNQYEMLSGYPQKDKESEMSICSSASDECESWTGTRIVQDFNDVSSFNNGGVVGTETLKCFSDAGHDNNLESEITLHSAIGRDAAIFLLKKEIECALKSLKEVQAQMDKMQSEKEEILASERCSRKSIESLLNQTVIFRDAIDNFQDVFELKVSAVDGKIRRMEEAVQESLDSWFQQTELLEDELDDAKLVAAQKTIEASCILKKFEEVQDTVKEADIMINELVIANEALKLSAHDTKAKENEFNGVRINLMKEIQSLKLSNNLKDQNYVELEKKYDEDFVTMKKMISELEDVISEVQTTSMEDWMSVSSDFFSMKCQIHESTESIRKLLEEVWSEIIAKDCAVSVLHLCHMGILLETANGLNAENGLLHHGLCESNSTISELREHNLRSRRELEMCRVLKGKLLSDIKTGFDRISSKVDETGEVTLKLTSFKKKIQDLQNQEEVMLQRSNDIGSELTMLMKELDLSNKQAFASIMDQEKLLKEKDELLQYQEENFMLELLAKDFELLILSTELKQICLLKADAENALVSTLEVLENFKKEIVFKSLETASSELILHDKESRNEKLEEDIKVKESVIEISCSHISELQQQIQNLQNDVRLLEMESQRLQIELERRDEELGRINCLEKENESLLLQLSNCKAEYEVLHQELEDKKVEFEASSRNTQSIDVENHRLRDNVSVLENSIAKLEEDLTLARVEIRNLEYSQSSVQDDLCIRIQDLERQLGEVNGLKEENMCLRNELSVKEIKESEYLNAMNLRSLKNMDLAESADKVSSNILNAIEEKFIEIDDMFQKIDNEMEMGHIFVDQFQYVENLSKKLDSEILSLHTELLRKDDILKGLLFDMALLQESASNSKDEKDDKDDLLASLRALEKDLELKSLELEEAAAELAKISARELYLRNENQRINSLSQENAELLSISQDAYDARNSMEKELVEARIKIENLELEVAEMDMALVNLNKTTESLKSNLDTVTGQRDELDCKVFTLTNELEMARSLAEENEAIATEAREIAEMQKVHAEEKEEEVKLLERSIEELECTINVLEQKVDLVKGDAERQRLQREELELELLAFKEQMQNVRSNDYDVKRCLDEKEKNLQEAQKRVQLLENEIAARDAEISQCKAHISEINLHAEAQASEYKQKFKALEAMVEQVKSEVPAPNSANSSSNKMERNPSKSRGSGSPFKCIGLGLVQQIKSEKDEEGRQRIEELEALAASRQKEIFMLKARLAATESMTHDVIRDLLGVKLNMKNYANLVDNQQLHSLIEEAQHHSVEADVKDQEVVSLKQQINEFLKERNGWLEEIERKQAELMAALVALEKLRQQDQQLATENEMLKKENTIHKKRVMELEGEIKKLSGQQNIQQRIHHHAKIKEENNSLRCQNEELSSKLHKTEAILSRVKEELTQFRVANGRSAYIDFDEEQLLHKKLKETDEERLQLAQKLLGLCTSVLRAAGITRPASEIGISVAEAALEQLTSRVVALQMELEDAKLKVRISDERIRLSELMPSAAAISRADENCPERVRASQTPFLSAFDR